MAEIYIQRKYWPTRRIHLYQQFGGDGYAICGGAWEKATYVEYKPFEWIPPNKPNHPYDDLNFCQSCRRCAEKRHGAEYKPLTEAYNKIAEEIGQSSKIKKLADYKG